MKVIVLYKVVGFKQASPKFLPRVDWETSYTPSISEAGERFKFFLKYFPPEMVKMVKVKFYVDS